MLRSSRAAADEVLAATVLNLGYGCRYHATCDPVQLWWATRHSAVVCLRLAGSEWQRATEYYVVVLIICD